MGSFNTQPPEGSWVLYQSAANLSLNVSTRSRPKAAGCTFVYKVLQLKCFNTQPPEGSWVYSYRGYLEAVGVSTRSRPKAAGNGRGNKHQQRFSFNTQPPEGSWSEAGEGIAFMVCFNTQPPEGSWECIPDNKKELTKVSTRSRPKAAGFGKRC